MRNDRCRSQFDHQLPVVEIGPSYAAKCQDPLDSVGDHAETRRRPCFVGPTEYFVDLNTPAIPSMSDSFQEWQRLSDAYIIGIEALANGKPGAALEAMRISRELQNCAGAEDHKAIGATA